MGTTDGSSTVGQASASIRVEERKPGAQVVVIEGRLDANTVAGLWRKAKETMARAAAPRTVVDGRGIVYCDGAGIGLLFTLQRVASAAGQRDLEIVGLKEDYARLLNRFVPETYESPPSITQNRGFLFEEIGRMAVTVWHDVRDLIAFVGELFVALLQAGMHPARTRWKDAIHSAEQIGVNALPIVVLVCFLVGLVMAFQAALPMRQFGTDIYVADLVALSMLRELGPLMTAILLAGRTGSALAAELGTMKINEEVDALTTMGLDPVRFLVVTRVVAAVLVTPLLTVFANLAGLVGGCTVMCSLGFPVVTYVNEVLSSVNYVDLLGGLVKSVVFGLLVAAIGCLRGLKTQSGPSAVGISATRAVVMGIVAIIVVDGVFAVVYHYLGI
ncbi:MAG: MlaE family lipid ABC transporter permease subunit [Planctomycetes bacterium]|nr:MlaE family lipid ABC transporter permease subunit [Planctomycetota bacterium]